MKYFVFLSIVSSFIYSSCFSKAEQVPLPFYNSPDFTPDWIEKDAPDFNQIHTITDFEFVNQNGETISQKTFNKKIYVADFFFTTCPGICPKLTKNMHLLQNAFIDDADVLLLSHTVTPWIDSIPRLREYADNQEILDDKWHLVTGDKASIYNIARQSYFADKDIGFQKTADDFLHTENFILVDQNRRIRGVYNGTLPLEVKQLIDDIKQLKEEG